LDHLVEKLFDVLA